MNRNELQEEYSLPGEAVGKRESPGTPPERTPHAMTPMAICYDFDGTLAPGRMQDRQFIPSTIGMDIEEFWEEVNRNTIRHQADPILSYMLVMLEKARQAGVIIHQSDLAQTGPGITFFPGVQEWFERANQYAAAQGVRLSHFAISSGNSEIIENTRIANEFERIYASRFIYDQEDRAIWPARIINFINKPNYLYRINKGALDQQDLFMINEFIPEPERAVPFENLIYIGDGETDIPCFQTITSQGGLAIAVHQPEAREDAQRYLAEGRVQAAAVADYRPRTCLDRIVQCQIDLVATRGQAQKHNIWRKETTVTSTTPVTRAQELRERIQRNDHLYYVQDQPAITDREYDALMRELREIEQDHPEARDPNSPTMRVGGAVAAGFPEVQHPSPMLSLANAMDLKEFQDWHERITRRTGQEEFTITMEPKIDGLAIRLVYQDGRLHQAITRGNGTSGEDVTHNVRTIRDLPLVLHSTPDNPAPPYLEVRGEVYMSRKVFQEASRAREERGDQPFANPRNAAAGTIRQLDPALASGRRLSAWIYGHAQPDTQTHHQALMALREWGLPVNPLIQNCRNVEEAHQYHQRLMDARDSLDYEIDGVVAKVNQLDLQEQMGATNREPRWAIAWKFPSGQAITTLREIRISHGRFGRLTPVAVLDPVELGGVTVQSASLHNLEDIRRKDIRPNTQVVMERAGDVIPQVTGPADPEENARAEHFRMPENCPSCGAGVETGGNEAGHWCPNQDCPALLPEQLRSFVGKRAMEIDGLGEHFCQQLVDQGLVANTADLYFVTREQWLTLDRMGERLANRIQRNIEASKQRPLDRVLYALGIFRLGRDVSGKMAQNYSSMNELQSLSEDQLMELEGVGPEIAQSVVKGFQSPRVVQTIRLLEQAGVGMTQDQKEKEKENNMTTGRSLAGKTFVVTGKLEGMSRNDAQMLIVQNGGKTSSSVTRSTDYLVVGEKPGSKLTKANELGVKVIDQNQLQALIG